MIIKTLSELDNFVEKKGQRKRIALAVSQDAYSLNAIYKAYKNGVIDPVFVGNEKETKKIAEVQGLNFYGAMFINEENDKKAVEIAVRMVSEGRADILMKGKIATPILLKAVLNKKWGLRTGRLLSHLSIFEVEKYHKLIGVTDVAMNISPSLKDKIQIVENSVEFFNKMGVEAPKVAVLGAIEMVNENMQATLDAALLSKMNQRDQIKNCIIDGPLAFDNAISAISAKNKSINSDVAGDTDILLMPDIEVGNVLYKSLVWFANAKVASIVLGASAPIVLTSRSDSEQSKYDSIVISTLL